MITQTTFLEAVKNTMETETETEAVGGGNVIKGDYKYTRVKYKKGGRSFTSQISGDSVSNALLGADDGELRDVLDENGCLEQVEGKIYPNQGMFRMAVGQILRARIRRNEPVQVKGKNIKTLDQKFKSPFVD